MGGTTLLMCGLPFLTDFAVPALIVVAIFFVQLLLIMMRLFQGYTWR
ncbi:MAG: hypothetical protein GDA36_10655 [Rhodobacteraceae bacterium]|nr:hypothetical protein [Paracoccaceae bacterium]